MLAGIHFFGAFLLLAASILILITTISAPVVDQLSILKVSLRDQSQGTSVRFGTFGWCILDGGNDGGNACSSVQVGYNPANVMRSIENVDFSDYAEDTARILTKIMILHPIATGLCFIGALLGAVSGMIGSFIASLIALLSFIVALVALICDFVLFSVLKSNINDNTSDQAEYAEGIWTLLAGTVCALLASAILFLTCCFGRRRQRKHTV